MEFDCEMFDDSEAALDALLGSAQWQTPDAAMTARLTALVQGIETATPTRVVADDRDIPVMTLQGPLEVVEEEPVTPATAPEVERVGEPDAIMQSLGCTGDPSPEIVEETASAADPITQQHPSPEEIQYETPLNQLPADPSVGEMFPLQEPAHSPDELPPIHRRTVPPRAPRPLRFITAIAACLIGAVGVAWMLLRSVTRQANPPAVGWVDETKLPGRAPTPMELWLISPAGQKHLEQRRLPATPLDSRQSQLAALCRNGDAKALATALVQQSDDQSRRAITQSLFSRPGGIDRYLDLILNVKTRDATLETVHALPPDATQRLLESLNSTSVARRLAAAKALGTVCQGDLLPQLQQMIQSGDHRREALAVLSECQDAQALAYIKKLRHDPMLSSQYAVVRSEMQQLF